MKEELIGLSTTYYATQDFSIYESVSRIVELGFNTVELGAAHSYEENIWNTLEKIRKDFLDINFAIHNPFPPLKQKLWFNSADGLNKINKHVIDNLFRASGILDAILISMHAPILNELSVGEEMIGNFTAPVFGKEKDRQMSMENFLELVEHMDNLSEKNNIKIAIENMEYGPFGILLRTANDFNEIFKMFSNIGLLLDMGHARSIEDLNDLLRINKEIFEIHIHAPSNSIERKNVAHLPVKDISFFYPIRDIIKNNEIPVVFEHGADVSEAEILQERHLFVNFIRNIDKSKKWTE